MLTKVVVSYLLTQVPVVVLAAAELAELADREELEEQDKDMDNQILLEQEDFLVV